MRIIGFSTGCLYKKYDPASIDAVNAIRRTGANAIELCGVKKDRFYAGSKVNFLQLEAKAFAGFEYVSLHAPCDLVYDNSQATIGVLDTLALLCSKLPIKRVIMHPDTVQDWDVIKRYNLPFAFENMDARKGRMTRPDELAPIARQFRLVYDATHAFTCDSTMALGRNIVTRFADRIAQIHCSGYFVHGKDEQQHFPACLEEEHWGRKTNLPHQATLSTIPSGIPVIIESVIPDYCFDSEAVLKAELNFISSRLK